MQEPWNPAAPKRAVFYKRLRASEVTAGGELAFLKSTESA